MGQNGWWFANALENSPVFLVSWIVWVIGSITLHELAHGWAAIRSGDTTPIETGHMTPNPLVHMGTWSLVMFALVGIAWGAMPVDPSRFRGRYDDAKVSFAGPAMNLSLALIAAILLVVWQKLSGSFGASMNLSDNLSLFLFSGVWLNIALAIFNMIPVPPLDGSRVLATFWAPYDRFMRTEQAQLLSVFAPIILFVFAGRHVFDASVSIADVLVRSLTF